MALRPYGVAEGTRDEILAELDQYGADRHAAGKEGKATDFAAAMAAVEYGALEIRVGHTLYRVVGEPLPPQYITMHASREKILAEIRWLREAHAGREDEPRFEDLSMAVVKGAAAVFAGGTLYRVIED